MPQSANPGVVARDLLYKYFGQLELLELRFSEIRLNFPWRDAFTNKLIVQTSIAYEKASILFQIAATHSAIAVSQSRSDPEGIKRAFYYFKSSAGMLTYINENFLHAPSTDLSRDVLKFLINIVLAQATEVFFEKTSDEKRPNALVSKIASQTASMYTTLTEDAKEFMGKGIFDRNWVTLLQVKLLRHKENDTSNLYQRSKQSISLLSPNIIGVLRTMQQANMEMHSRASFKPKLSLRKLTDPRKHFRPHSSTTCLPTSLLMPVLQFKKRPKFTLLSVPTRKTKHSETMI